MTRKAHDALKASIRHWKRMAIGKRKDNERPISAHCALCEQFLCNGDERRCKGCPVMQRTGRVSCNGTPYDLALRAWVRYGLSSEEFKYAARQEIEFLESLLPKNKPTKP